VGLPPFASRPAGSSKAIKIRNGYQGEQKYSERYSSKGYQLILENQVTGKSGDSIWFLPAVKAS